MNVEVLIRHPEYGNFVCVYMGLAFVGQCLEDYTRNGLQQVYQTVYTALAGTEVCKQQCKAVSNSVSSWCNTCKDWRRKLMAFHSNLCRDVDWSKQEPWKWPMSCENMAALFIKIPDTSGEPVNIRDLSNACSLWKRCKVFNIRPIVLKNISKCRNHFFAHNDTLLVDAHDKAKVFDALRDLVRDSDVEPFVNVQDCLKQLSEIEQGDQLTTAITEIRKEIQKLCHFGNETTKTLGDITTALTGASSDRETKNSQVNISTTVEDNKECLARITRSIDEIEKETKLQTATLNVLKNINKRNSYSSRTPRLFLVFVCMFILIMVAVFKNDLFQVLIQESEFQEANRPHGINSVSDCLSEGYTFPFREDLPLLGYLSTQNKLIGRQWVFDILEQNLFHRNTSSSSRGILLIAGYGFGKSAIVAQMVCAANDEKGWILRKHLVAFHVCKFNVENTRSPVRLVRRVIGFLSMKSAEYGHYITMNENSILFDENKCEANIYACFDLAVTIPFDKLTLPDDAPWIVVIDALDECVESDGHNPILDLLSNRIVHIQQQGRKWLKWVMTSRPMKSLIQLRKLDAVSLNSKDERNIEDIRKFILSNLPDYTETSPVVRSVAANSGGNILYIKFALEYISESGNLTLNTISRLPDTMEEIYELNFDRIFEKNNDFQVAKPVFELMCTSSSDRHKMLSVLMENNVTNQTDFERVLDRLSFFIFTDFRVSFTHRSLYEWLCRGNNSKYRISVEKGHAMMSNYLFNGISDCHIHGLEIDSSDIWHLVEHVSKSRDKFLSQKFVSLNFTYCKISRYLNQFGGIGSFFDKRSEISVKLMELILEFLSKTYNGDIGEMIADHIYLIARDKLDIFKFLYRKIAHLKRNFLLHGSARYCKVDMAKYLLFDANVSVIQENEKGLRASDIACGRGCIDVLKLISKKDKSMLDMRCLSYALKLGEKDFKGLINSLEFDLKCFSGIHHERSYSNIFPAIKFVYFDNLILSKKFLEEDWIVSEKPLEEDVLIDYLHTFFRYTVLHTLVFSYSEAYLSKMSSEICKITDEPYCEKMINIAISQHFKHLPHSNGQIPIEIDSSDHYYYYENRDDIYGRTSYAFRSLAKMYPTMLTCSDVQGFTPPLLTVPLNKVDLLSEVLESALEDRCQPVSSLMLYIFWYITERHKCALYTNYYHYRWCWYYRKFSCPTYASLEHLLMRYERDRMIDLVIANGYTLNWTKTDLNGKTPLDYARPAFIHQLELHFGVQIQALSSKEELDRLCQWKWTDCLLLLLILVATGLVFGLYIIIVYYSVRI